jgi:hypothetical protein
MISREEFESHWVSDVPQMYRASALEELRANRSDEFGYGRDELRWAWDAWQESRRVALQEIGSILMDQSIPHLAVRMNDAMKLIDQTVLQA